MSRLKNRPTDLPMYVTAVSLHKKAAASEAEVTSGQLLDLSSDGINNACDEITPREGILLFQAPSSMIRTPNRPHFEDAVSSKLICDKPKSAHAFSMHRPMIVKNSLSSTHSHEEHPVKILSSQDAISSSARAKTASQLHRKSQFSGEVQSTDYQPFSSLEGNYQLPLELESKAMAKVANLLDSTDTGEIEPNLHFQTHNRFVESRASMMKLHKILDAMIAETRHNPTSGIHNQKIDSETIQRLFAIGVPHSIRNSTVAGQGTRTASPTNIKATTSATPPMPAIPASGILYIGETKEVDEVEATIKESRCNHHDIVQDKSLTQEMFKEAIIDVKQDAVLAELTSAAIKKAIRIQQVYHKYHTDIKRQFDATVAELQRRHHAVQAATDALQAEKIVLLATVSRYNDEMKNPTQESGTPNLGGGSEKSAGGLTSK